MSGVPLSGFVSAFATFIAAIIGLVVSLLSSLGRVSTILRAVVVILLSALEIYFFTHTDGFNFYSPNVVGWKWSIIWSLCLFGFWLMQIFLWGKVLLAISDKSEAVGNSVTFSMLAVLGFFVVIMISMFMDTRTAGVREALIFKVFLTVQALITAYLFTHVCMKQGVVKAVMITPFYAIGLAAIGYMGRDLFVVAIISAVLWSIFKTFFSGVASGGFFQRAVGQSGGKTIWKWGDEE